MVPAQHYPPPPPPLLLSSPQDTHKPLPVSLSSPGASGEGIPERRPLQSVHQRGRETDSLSALDSKHSAVSLCLQHLSFCIKRLICSHYQVRMNLS